MPPPLPDHVVRLTRLPEGIELYFPPFRTPGAALSLALFGVACFIPGLFAAIAVAPLAISDAAGMIAIWLMSIFILPFIAFGALFVARAGYLIANSLTVVVTGSGIRSVRHILGFPLRERRVARADIAALDAVARLPYRWPRDDVPFYELVARTKRGAAPALRNGSRSEQSARGHAQDITVAESLRGEELMERVRAEIVSAARLEHLPLELAAEREGSASDRAPAG